MAPNHSEGEILEIPYTATKQMVENSPYLVHAELISHPESSLLLVHLRSLGLHLIHSKERESAQAGEITIAR